MAKNMVFECGHNLSLPVPALTVSGAPVKVGAIVGVCLTNVASATDNGGGNAIGNATVATRGVYSLNVVGALTVGQLVYIVAADNTLTATVGVNTIFGAAIAAQAATGIVPVKISAV